LEETLDISSMIIDADHMDERNFFPAQFKNRADAFMEMLLAKRKSTS
jgi:benzoyl-CoA reductase/2-hydroxyglutaryl-CoA dehydratase subunit BcrC/BadD/HgdB